MFFMFKYIWTSVCLIFSSLRSKRFPCEFVEKSWDESKKKRNDGGAVIFVYSLARGKNLEH